MAICEDFEAITKRFPHFAAHCETEGDPPSFLEIRLLDSLDTDTSRLFSIAVETHLKAYPSIRMLNIDASKVHYLSSTGLGAIASVYMFAQSHGVDFLLVNPSPHVNMLLKLLGFEIFIPIKRNGRAE